MRETPDRVIIYDGPREVTTHPREPEPRTRYLLRPEHRPPRGEGWRRERDPFPEETALTLDAAGHRLGLAHVRRKFVEAEPHQPGPCGEVLDLIGQLYAVERACPAFDPTASAAAQAHSRQLRGAARREQSIAIVVKGRPTRATQGRPYGASGGT